MATVAYQLRRDQAGRLVLAAIAPLALSVDDLGNTVPENDAFRIDDGLRFAYRR